MADNVAQGTASTEQQQYTQTINEPVSPLEPAAMQTHSATQDRATSPGQPQSQSQPQPQTQTHETQRPFAPHPQAQTQVPPPPPSPTYLEKLSAGERNWQWKHALRFILLIVAIIGLGTTAAATASSLNNTSYYDSSWVVIWGLVTFSCSIIWATLLLTLFLVRKRPTHPGLVVAIDLLLWLAYIFTGLLLTYAAARALDFGAGGFIQDYDSSYGDYELAANGTWVWTQSDYGSYYGGDDYTRPCDHNSTSSYASPRYYYGDDDFPDCAAQDAYVNMLWRTRGSRAGVIVTATVCQWLALLLHFVLFVWACVDTSRHRAAQTSTEAQVLASQIIGNMLQQGAIVTQPQRAYWPLGGPGGQIPMQDMKGQQHGYNGAQGYQGQQVYNGQMQVGYQAGPVQPQGWPLTEQTHMQHAQAAGMNIPAGKTVYR